MTPIRFPRMALAVLAAALAAGCARDPVKGPLRPKTHGYRATVTVKGEGGVVLERFEMAVRGARLRKEPPAGEAGPVLLVNGETKTAVELDPAAKTYRDVPYRSSAEILPDHPVLPGFSQAEEAQRRNIRSYARESDTVYSGHVCWLFRFADDPEEPTSPTTTYWVAPDLDMLVIRRDRTVLREGLLVEERSSQMTSVRVQALPALFEVPKGYTKKT